MSEFKRPPIAVVGLGAVFPGGEGIEPFWRNVVAGKDLISEVPARQWRIADYYDPDPRATDRTYSKRGAFIDPVDFDVLTFGMPPSSLNSTDIAQLLALHTARSALQDAEKYGHFDRKKTSIILGVGGVTQLAVHMSSRMQRPYWAAGLRSAGVPDDQIESLCAHIADQFLPWKETTFPGLLANVIAGRVANRLDLGGTNCTIDAACASSFAALSMALGELYTHSADAVLAGGVDFLNDVLMYMCFSKTGAMSAADECRPFSDQADGTLMGEGTGMFVLRRLEDAERDGNQIYAVIRGCGSSSDGRGLSVYAPDSKGQSQAIRRAYLAAGFEPSEIELIEAHGTATKAGDVAEMGGLSLVFEGAERARPWCALGSVKSQIGHTKGAAGAAGLIKTILALRHRILPPTIKVDTPNGKLDWTGPFYLNRSARPWFSPNGKTRKAGVSSFGFGGSNFHVAVEEYRGPGLSAVPLSTEAWEVFTYSGPDAEAVSARITRDLAALDANTPMAVLGRAARDQASSGDAIRVAVVADDAATLKARLESARRELAQGIDARAPQAQEGCYTGSRTAAEPLAFIFPGQGSQYVDMGRALAVAWPSAHEIWERAQQGWQGERSLGDLVFPPLAFSRAESGEQRARLTATEHAQPALAAATASYLALLRACGVTPLAVAGHSFGELAALFAAGVVDEAGFFELSRQRGHLMALAARDTAGAMLAVIGDLTDLPRQLGPTEVTVANYNSPTQVVLSGGVTAIDRAAEVLGNAGLACTRLSVGTAFHSPIVAPAADQFRRALRAVPLRAPTLPVVSCEDGSPYPDAPDAVADRLGRQLAVPVRFVAQIEALYARGARTFVEVGPGTTLSRLAGSILKGRPHHTVTLDDKARSDLSPTLNALAQLWADGHARDIRPLWGGLRPPVQRTVNAKTAHALTGALDHAPTVQKDKSPTMSSKPQSAPPLPPTPATTTQIPSAPATGNEPASGATAFQMQVAFQQTLLEAHKAYLATLTALAGNGGANVALPVPQHQVAPPTWNWLASASPHPAAAHPAPVPAPTAPSRLIPEATPAPKSHPIAVPAAAAEPHAAPITDLEGALRFVIAEVTGYPMEVLQMDMTLEDGLGIDSIKRVEVLAALKKRIPNLPELDPTQLARLRTLQSIADAIRATDAGAPRADARTGGEPVPSATSVPSLPDLVFDVVAESTGYPRDVLELDMTLEDGLGIDSIKRVEILAHLKKRAPGIREPDATALARVRTLRDVLSLISDQPAQLGQVAIVERETVRTPLPGPPVVVSRFSMRLDPAPPLAQAIRADLPKRRIGVSGTGRLPGAIVEALRARGVAAAAYSSNAADPDLGGLIVVDGLDATDAGSAVQGYLAGLAAVQAAAPALRSTRGFVVTVQDAGGFGVGQAAQRPWSGGLAGLARTIDLEWPDVMGKAIDVFGTDGDPHASAQAIVRELFEGADHRDVFLDRDGKRFVLADHAHEPHPGKLPLDPGDTVLVSGGARGVTVACLEALCREVRLHIVLLGRSPIGVEDPATAPLASESQLVEWFLRHGSQTSDKGFVDLGDARRRATEVLRSREVQGTLDALRALGSTVEYVAIDVTDKAAVARVLKTLGEQGRKVAGLIHAAGINRDKQIEEKNLDDARAVLTTKLVGAENLLAGLDAASLRCLVVFSSVAGRHGNVGQVDYAMANAALMHWLLALPGLGRGVRARALLWGPWEGGMVTPALQRIFEARGLALIEPHAGAQRFVEELKDETRVAAIVLGAQRLTSVTADAAE